MSKPCSDYEFRDNLNAKERDDIIEWLNEHCKKWVFQAERGETGYEHWQGNFSLKKKSRKATMMKDMFDDDFKCFMHLEPMSGNGRRSNAEFYATKKVGRIDGPYFDKTHEETEQYIPRQYRDLTLRPWQADVVKHSQDFNDRWINWIGDMQGNLGKSTIAHYCRLFHKAIVLPATNDQDRLVASACDIMMAMKIRDPKMVFIDLPRAQDKKTLGGLLAGIEQIKSGYIYDMRHEFRSWDFDSPQIWVFSNMPPPQSAMSRDRWRFWNITPTGLVQVHNQPETESNGFLREES